MGDMGFGGFRCFNPPIEEGEELGEREAMAEEGEAAEDEEGDVGGERGGGENGKGGGERGDGEGWGERGSEGEVGRVMGFDEGGEGVEEFGF